MTTYYKDKKAIASHLQAVEWERRTAEEILKSIDSALAEGAYLAARKLAMDGAREYPNNAELEKISTLLAPPEVAVSNREPDPGIRANRDWLRNNRTEYLGAWVAVKKGELLHAADSIEELLAMIGEVKNKNILITKVY
jgi:hypothetical protein